MRFFGKTVGGLALTAALAIGVGTGIASAGGSAAGPVPTTQPPAGPHPALTPAAIGDNTNESTFTQITPCRVIDTRAQSPIASGTARSFKVRGSVGFTLQGGHNGGCNIPNDAVAVALNVTTLDATGHGGVVRAYPQGAAKPSTAIASINQGLTLTSGGTVALCVPAASCGGFALRIAADFGSTDVLVDATGYYRNQAYALVNADSSLGAHSSRVLSAQQVGAAYFYQVNFDRDVSSCSYQATGYFGGIFEVEPRSGVADAVFVASYNDSGTPTSLPFYLTVTC
ncbi:MAG: hypothetical protein ACR2FF_10465 [Mycobacteriales bacterium]